MCQFLKNERGVAAIEYSLIITLIMLVMVGTLHVLGPNLVDAFLLISERLPSLQVIEDPENKGLLNEF